MVYSLFTQLIMFTIYCMRHSACPGNQGQSKQLVGGQAKQASFKWSDVQVCHQRFSSAFDLLIFVL